MVKNFLCKGKISLNISTVTILFMIRILTPRSLLINHIMQHLDWANEDELCKEHSAKALTIYYTFITHILYITGILMGNCFIITICFFRSTTTSHILRQSIGSATLAYSCHISWSQGWSNVHFIDWFPVIFHWKSISEMCIAPPHLS